MKIADYLKQSGGRKIIITKTVALANSLMRNLNIKDGIDIIDAEPKTLRDICKEIAAAYYAAVGLEPFEYTDSVSEVYILEDTLRNMTLKTISPESLSIPTVRDILARINELRMNDLSDEWQNDNSDKVTDLKNIIAAYEKRMKDGKLLDIKFIYEKAIEILSWLPVRSIDGIMINAEFLLPWIKDFKPGVFNIERMCDIEKRCINALCNAAGLDGYEVIDVFEKGREKPDFGPGGNLSGRAFKSYGMANEVTHVVNSIAAETVAYGDIAVYYSSPAYINYIKASFENAGIPYVLTNGYSAQDLDLTQFMLDLIAAAKENFSYALLKPVALNSKVTFENVQKDAGDSIYINPIKGYNTALNDGIAWGKERYAAYKERVYADFDTVLADPASEDRQKSSALGMKIFAKFLMDFCDIFDSSKSASQILTDLWAFTDLYTYKTNPERGKLKEILLTHSNDLKYLNDKSKSLEEKLELIEDFIENITVSDDSDPAAVSISLLNNMQAAERSRLYVIGLSAGNFGLQNRQSPFLLDSEKKRFIPSCTKEDSSVVIASEKNLRRRRAAFKTLATVKSGKADFLYNKFDTVTLKESSPSVFFLEVTDAMGLTDQDIKDAAGYRTVSCDMAVSSADVRKAVKPVGEVLKAEREEYNKARGISPAAEKDVSEAIRMSATGLQTLLECPLMYYYQYMKGLRIYDQKEFLGYVWMGPFAKGNFCHYTYQKYFRNCPPDPINQNAVNAAEFERIIEETVAEIEAVEPAPSDTIKERDLKKYKGKMKHYLESVLSSWNADAPWQVIGCELGFDNLEYKGTGSNSASLILNGSIDRMDGYVDDDEVLHIRIVDYKTGKLLSKEKEVYSGVQIQHFMYAIAAIDYINNHKDDICQILGSVDFSECSIDSVKYVFPYEESGNESLETIELFDPASTGFVLNGAPEDLYVDFPDYVKALLDDIIGAHQAGDADGCNKAMEDDIENRLSAADCSIEDFCSGNFCDYKFICRKHVGGAGR